MELSKKQKLLQNILMKKDNLKNKTFLYFACLLINENSITDSY